MTGDPGANQGRDYEEKHTHSDLDLGWYRTALSDSDARPENEDDDCSGAVTVAGCESSAEKSRSMHGRNGSGRS